LLFTEWLESKSYHEAARAVEGDVMGVKRVRNEVSVEVERALLGTSLHTFRIDSFFSSPFERAHQGHMHPRCRLMTDV
jgi:hypothetical protein